MEIRVDGVGKRSNTAVSEGCVPAAGMSRPEGGGVKASIPIRGGRLDAPANVARRIADQHGPTVTWVGATAVSIGWDILFAQQIHVGEPVKHAGGLETAHSIHRSILQVGDAVVATKDFFSDALSSPAFAFSKVGGVGNSVVDRCSTYRGTRVAGADIVQTTGVSPIFDCGDGDGLSLAVVRISGGGGDSSSLFSCRHRSCSKCL